MSDRPFLRLLRIWRDFVTQLQINANEEAINFVIESFYIMHSSIFYGLLPWPFSWPIMQTAGFPWTSYRIKTGIFLMKEMKRSQHLLNNAVDSYLGQKKSKSDQQVKDVEVTEEMPEKVDGQPRTEMEELAQAIEAVSLDQNNTNKSNQQGKTVEVAEEIPVKVDGEPSTVIEELAQAIEAVNLEPENYNVVIDDDDDSNWTDISSEEENDREEKLRLLIQALEAIGLEPENDNDDTDDDDDSSWTDVSSEEGDDPNEELRLFAALPFSCSCTFNALKIDLANDEIAIDHLKKMNFGCECIFHGDLYSITTNYQAILGSYVYIAKAIQMDETADQITQILAEIPGKLAQFSAQHI